MPIEDETVQAQIAMQLVQISAESGQSGAGPSTEDKMLELNQAELQLSAQRIQSQNAREAAQIAQKDRELDLKELEIMGKMDAENTKAKINATGKVLDNSTRLADIQASAKRADIQAQKRAETANQSIT
jgi:hypothetical protein